MCLFTFRCRGEGIVQDVLHVCGLESVHPPLASLQCHGAHTVFTDRPGGGIAEIGDVGEDRGKQSGDWLQISFAVETERKGGWFRCGRVAFFF